MQAGPLLDFHLRHRPGEDAVCVPPGVVQLSRGADAGRSPGVALILGKGLVELRFHMRVIFLRPLLFKVHKSAASFHTAK